MTQPTIVEKTKELRRQSAANLVAAREAAGFKRVTDATNRFGWNYSSYRAHETGQNGMKPAEAEKYAAAYGVSPELFLLGKPSAAEKANFGIFRPAMIPGSELVGRSGFPIYAAAQGGSGHHIVSTDIIETAKWPSILEGVRGAYGLLIYGDSMSPAYREGDIALIHPSRPMARDEDHVFYDHPPFGGPGETEAIIKNLVSWTDTHYMLKQYNPGHEFTVERIDWPVCHRVVGKYASR